MASIADRFWSKVKKTSTCWLWTAGTKDGYGWFSENGNPDRAHRVSWRLSGKRIPKGRCVLHRCDVRNCVRPSHLFLGTKITNNRDRHQKGRSVRGESHGRARLTENQAIEVKARRLQGESLKSLAGEFKISPDLVSQIGTGRKWKHLEIRA